MLEVENLTIVPPGSAAAACSEVSFTLRRGERVALVGPSGAGKTTLLKALNGTVLAQAGRIIVDNKAVDFTRRSDRRAVRKRIALIPQKHDLVESLRVHHNVMAGALGRWSDWRALRFLIWPTAEELAEARQALERVGLAEKLRARADALSGGQQQRVAIARALVQRPQVILADEPIASLDPDTAHRVLELLCRLAADAGVALLCTLHQPDLAGKYFSRVLEMREGRLSSNPRTTASMPILQAHPLSPAQQLACGG